MKKKKALIFGIAVLAIVALAFGGYNIYRFPDMFRSLSDRSLSEEETEALKAKILSQGDAKVLIAYFSYSGTTKTWPTS